MLYEECSKDNIEQATIWMTMYLIILLISILASGLTAWSYYRNCHVRLNAAQCMIFNIFVSDCLWCFCRMITYCYFLANMHEYERLAAIDKCEGMASSYVSLGIRVLTVNDEKATPMLSAIVLLGDSFYLGSILWIGLATVELRRLILWTMDRGKDSEHRVISFSFTFVAGVTGVFFISTLTFILYNDGLDHWYDYISYGELAGIAVSFIFAGYSVSLIIWKRKREIAERQTLPMSPLFVRMRRLMMIYAILTFPSVLSNAHIVVNAKATNGKPYAEYKEILIGICTLLNYFMGIGNALIMGASQQCCIRLLRPIMPDDLYQEFLTEEESASRLSMDILANKDASKRGFELGIEAPLDSPVFVCTDIESSTKLWGHMPEAMTLAQDMHDVLIRHALVDFYGYEITTCGDAFHIAFHTVSDAIKFCVAVQEKLNKVKWPDAIVNCADSKTIKDKKGKVLYRGLRVRMGIHAGDDKVIVQKHPVTGRACYNGVSEIIAQEIGDVGFGGQIVISADSLTRYGEEVVSTPDLLGEDKFETRSLGERYFHGVKMKIALSEIIPVSLRGREFESIC